MREWYVESGNLFEDNENNKTCYAQDNFIPVPEGTRTKNIVKFDLNVKTLIIKKNTFCTTKHRMDLDISHSCVCGITCSTGWQRSNYLYYQHEAEYAKA